MIESLNAAVCERADLESTFMVHATVARADLLIPPKPDPHEPARAHASDANEWHHRLRISGLQRRSCSATLFRTHEPSPERTRGDPARARRQARELSSHEWHLARPEPLSRRRTAPQRGPRLAVPTQDLGP